MTNRRVAISDEDRRRLEKLLQEGRELRDAVRAHVEPMLRPRVTLRDRLLDAQDFQRRSRSFSQ